MCLSTAEKTTMAECLSANTNNNDNVFICSRRNWSGLQRKLANCNKVRVRQFSKIRIWTTFNICIVFVSHLPRFGPLSLTTAQRKENNLGSTSTQPHQIFPHLPPAVLERNGINQSEAGFSYHVPFPSVHFCKKRPLYIYAPHSKQRLCPWLMALLIETKQTWFDLMSLVDVIWLGLSRCYWMIYHCCFDLLLSACKISHLTPSEIPIEEMSWTLDKH